MPPAAARVFRALAAELRSRMPKSPTTRVAAYALPPPTLHCTIATLRPFRAARRASSALDAELVTVWRPLLDAAAADPQWPAAPFRLRWQRPTLGRACSISHAEDVDGAVVAMRACIRRACEQRNGVPAEGIDRRGARAVDGVDAANISHIPDIVHTSLMRWIDDSVAESPADDKCDPERGDDVLGMRDGVAPPGAEAAFAAAVDACWPSAAAAAGGVVEATLSSIALRVDRGYMHGGAREVWSAHFV